MRARVDPEDADLMRLTQPQKAQRLLIAERRNMKKSRRARIRLQWRQALLKLLEHLLHIRICKPKIFIKPNVCNRINLEII